MPVQNSVPQPLAHPVKKRKTDRTLHFLTRIAEKVFTEKIEKMLEKFLNRSSWILFCCLRLEEKKNCLEKFAKCYIIVTLFIFSFHKNIKMPSKRKKSHNLKQPADPLGK